MPMIWWGLPNPQLEKIILKCITTEFLKNGLDVYVYHYRRGQGSGGKVTQPSASHLSQLFSRKYSYSNSPPKKKSRVEIVDDDDEIGDEVEAEEDEQSEEEDFTETETEREDDEEDMELTDEEDDEVDD